MTSPGAQPLDSTTIAPRRARALIGPFVIGVAVWCAAGSLTVLTPSAATSRVAVPAPWWVFVGAMIAASLVPMWRRDARYALPALCSTLPWWPVPLPAVALVWTGPMAWVPIGVSLAAAIGWAPVRWMANRVNAMDPRVAPVIAGVLAGLLGTLTAISASPITPTDDEPHYLIITQSLLKDHDLKIENNHRDRDYAAYFPGTINPDYRARGKDGQIYSIHAPGVSVIVLPAFALGGYLGARMLLLLLAAIAASVIWRLGWLVTDDASAAWFGWAAVVFSPTFLFHSFEVYPDGPGLLAVAVAALVLVRLARPEGIGTRGLVSAGIALGTLPWLHTRFVVLAITFGIAIALRLVGERRGVSKNMMRLGAFAIVPIVSVLLWLGYFQMIYGSPSPAAAYGGAVETRPWFVNALAALFFDGQYGLTTYAPALIVALIAWRWRTRIFTRRLATELGLIALTYAIAASMYWMWWAGLPATPARFITAALPLFAIPAAVGWARASTNARTAMAMLAVLSLAIVTLVIGVDHTALAWNWRDGEARWLRWLGPVVNLPRAWPSFFWFLGRERWFSLHVALWLSVFGGGWCVAKRAIHSTRSARLVVSGWLLVSVTIVAQLGWWLTAASSLDAATSQFQMLAAMSRGARVVAIDAWHVGRGRSLPAGFVIARLAAGQTDVPPPVFVANDVPAGDYDLHIHLTRVRPLALTLGIGTDANVYRVITPRATSEQIIPFRLPTAVTRLTIDADADGRAAIASAEVLPRTLRLGATGEAQSLMRYGGTDVFFLGDGAYPEPSGFWVRGGGSVDVSVAPEQPQATVHLELRNGARANTITIETGGHQDAMEFAINETRGVDVPIDPVAGAARVTITTRTGFVPADVEANSTDRRLLGVWVSVK